MTPDHLRLGFHYSTFACCPLLAPEVPILYPNPPPPPFHNHLFLFRNTLYFPLSKVFVHSKVIIPDPACKSISASGHIYTSLSKPPRSHPPQKSQAYNNPLHSTLINCVSCIFTLYLPQPTHTHHKNTIAQSTRPTQTPHPTSPPLHSNPTSRNGLHSSSPPGPHGCGVVCFPFSPHWRLPSLSDWRLLPLLSPARVKYQLIASIGSSGPHVSHTGIGAGEGVEGGCDVMRWEMEVVSTFCADSGATWQQRGGGMVEGGRWDGYCEISGLGRGGRT